MDKETCGYVRWEHLERLLEHLDLFYLDIKHIDAHVHKEITGVSKVAGYNAFFTQLSKTLQDSIIARTEHGL